MFQRPDEQELVQLLAVPGTGGPPTEPVEHLDTMIAARAAFPTAVGGDQRCSLADGDPKLVSETIHLPEMGMCSAPPVSSPATARCTLHGSAQAVLEAVVRAEPIQVRIGQREVRDQVVIGNLVRPFAEPGEFGIGQKPNRPEACYRRRLRPDKTKRWSASGARKRILDRPDLARGAGAETLRVVRMVLVAARAASAR